MLHIRTRCRDPSALPHTSGSWPDNAQPNAQVLELGAFAEGVNLSLNLSVDVSVHKYRSVVKTDEWVVQPSVINRFERLVPSVHMHTANANTTSCHDAQRL